MLLTIILKPLLVYFFQGNLTEFVRFITIHLESRISDSTYITIINHNNQISQWTVRNVNREFVTILYLE